MIDHREEILNRLSLAVALLELCPEFALLIPEVRTNIHDLLRPEFFQRYGPIERVEVMSLLSGARWRPPSLGLGVTLLNLREFKDVRAAVESALLGQESAQ